MKTVKYESSAASISNNSQPNSNKRYEELVCIKNAFSSPGKLSIRKNSRSLPKTGLCFGILRNVHKQITEHQYEDSNIIFYYF
ncbi:hypothetical protein Anas_01849 [Armadillidium nasatum]|uniref:Uncharacterized protein n=1 Tax=Armadillidium nasatum TaxID=96803 RepID=A0A5N5SND5_9CRUS|nr:hypothetical protein Anas_01849 [Armadillidium nasatum]